MNIRTQRLIDAVVGQALCAVLSLWARLWQRTQPPVSEQPLRQVLVIMLSEMGSMVLAGPMFARIRQQHPQAQIHILQLARNKSRACCNSPPTPICMAWTTAPCSGCWPTSGA